MRSFGPRILLLLIAYFCNDTDQMDVSFADINKAVFHRLRNLASTDKFSLVEVNLSKPCKFKVEMCNQKGCDVTTVPGSEIRGPLIDLRSIPESYSPHGNGSSQIWKIVYDIASENKLLRTLLSGLHFSITIHISSFFFSVLGGFVPNSLYYLTRYKKDYRDNLYVLYIYIRASIYIMCRMDAKDPLTQKSMHVFGGLGNVDKDFFTKITKIYSLLDCLGCAKCKVWGKVQVLGIFSAAKLHSSRKNTKLSEKEIICLLRLFNCLSTSFVQIERIESLRWRCFSMLMNYRVELFYLSVGFSIFYFLRPEG